jgi:pteridine reductase
MSRNANGDEPAGAAPVALVTGGAVRIGRAICEALARDGYCVAIHHNASKAAATELAVALERLGAPAVALAADLTRPGAPSKLVARVSERFGRLDLLVNSAALFFEDDAGVVNIADVAAISEMTRHKAYSRTKAALLELTHRKALELAPRGVRINAVCPGTVLFPQGYSAAQRERIVRGIPLGRTGRPEDVAQAVVFLARATFVTGQVIAVDGGRMLRALDGQPSPPRDAFLN